MDLEENNKLLNEKFYRKSLREDSQRSFRLLSNIIIQEFNPSTVIDYGCGAAWVIYYLMEKGVDCIGIEPNPNAKYIAKGSTIDKVMDLSLTDKIDLNKKVDVSICLEVAEHIDEKHKDIIIENICRSTDLVFFSAATVGQGGYGHVNEQPFSYWLEIFKNNGFVLEEAISKRIRKYLKQNGANRWYFNNVRVMRRA